MITHDFRLIKQQLLNAIYENPATAFPEFDWQPNSKNPKYGLYTSSLHLTGLRQPRQYNAHQTYICDGKEDEHAILFDENGERVEILKYWKEKNGETFPNCPQLFALYGIEPPQKDPEAERKRIQRKTDTEELLETIRADFLGANGAKVREYLSKPIEEGGRGYDNATIESMAGYMGVITANTAKVLAQLTGLHIPPHIEESHPLVLLTISKRTGAIQYAKFRAITPTATGGDKWRNPTKKEEGTGRDDVEPFGYHNTKFVGADGCQSVVVVESEICSAHATAKGIKNVIALRGSDGIKPQLIRRLIADYCKRIVLLFDNDKKGAEATKKAILQIQRATNKISVAVAHIDDAKDPDELLAKHPNGAKELQTIIDNAQLATTWTASQAVEQYKQATTEEEREEVTQNLLAHVADLRELGQYRNADTIANYYCSESNVLFTAESFVKEAKRREEERARENYEKRLKKAFNELDTARSKDDPKAIKYALLELEGINEPTNDPETHPNKESTFTDIFGRLYHDADKDIKTSYKLWTYRPNNGGLCQIPLKLYSNGITYFSAGTSHGKSTALQNIAIDLLGQGKRVLYYGFEETKTDTILELLNIFIHKKTASQNYYDLSEDGSTSAINKFFKDQDPEVFDRIPKEERKRIADCIYGFFHEYRGIDNGEHKLYLYDDALTSAELVQHIADRIEIIHPDAIFVDYVQFLQSEENVKGSQWEDYGKVSKDLIKINKATGVPLVVAAQLKEKNNEKSPENYRYTDIWGASSLAQGASAVYILNNSSKYPKETEIQYFDSTQPFGQSNQMLVKLDKNRFGACPAYALYDYHGAQRYINTTPRDPNNGGNANNNDDIPELA